MAGRGAALAALGVGILVIVGARLVIPTAPPLYDGILPLEPYRWLEPPPGQHGGAKGATAQIPVKGGKGPLIAVATPELEPQAQIYASPEGLTLPPGTRLIKVSIEPVPVEGVPADGHIDGNVYRLSVTDQDGTPLTAPASALVSIVLRAADPTLGEATIEQFSNGSWVPLKTSSAGFGASFLSVVTEFGDFAVIAPGAGPSAPTTSSPATPATSSASDSAVPIGSPRPSTGAGPPSAPLGDAGAIFPDWLLPALAAIGIATLILGYRSTRRSRRDPSRGADKRRRP